VFNHKARDFYAKHGVKVIAPPTRRMRSWRGQPDDHQALRALSMSLCPKQAKGVTGVQGTIKAEPCS
jgi:hypothetical protein